MLINLLRYFDIRKKVKYYYIKNRMDNKSVLCFRNTYYKCFFLKFRVLTITDKNNRIVKERIKLV